MGKLPRYKMTIDPECWMDGVDAISFVNEPAIDSNFLAFAKDKTKIVMAKTEEKERKVTGAIMIPNQIIYRRDESGYEYEVFYDAETIKLASEGYLKNIYGSVNTSLQHDLYVGSTDLVESWIVGKTDKSTDLGFEFPEGTWMVTLKVNSDTVWNEIEAGLANGFSLEGWFNLIPTDMQKQQKLSADDVEEDYSELLKDIEAGLNPKDETPDLDALFKTLEDVVKGSNSN